MPNLSSQFRRYPSKMSANPNIDTSRIEAKPQTISDAYAVPANFLEIDVTNPQTHGIGKKRYTDYEVRMTTNIPIFKLKESSVRRRYSDFEWLRTELERDSKIVVPTLPGKALKKMMPFRQDDGIFEDDFIEEWRRSSIELQAILSHRTNVVCICSCKNQLLTKTTCQARSETSKVLYLTTHKS